MEKNQRQLKRIDGKRREEDESNTLKKQHWQY